MSRYPYSVRRGEEFWAGTCGDEVLLLAADATEDGAWARLATFVCDTSVTLTVARREGLREVLASAGYGVRRFVALEVGGVPPSGGRDDIMEGETAAVPPQPKENPRT